MTLFRQIIVVFTLFFLVMLAVVLAISFNDSREYIENKLYTDAQNTASTLAVTMSQADGDTTKMSVMADAVFDTGYYRKIALKSMRGETIFEKSRDDRPGVPGWFVRLVDLKGESAFAQVSNGWQPLGMLEVVSDTTLSLEYLYALFKKIVTVFLVSMAVGVLIIVLILRTILRPLETMEKQAEGVLQNRFILNRDIPRPLELKRVTLAINGLVERMEQMHKKLVEQTRKNRELEYRDTLTGLNNRRFFVIRYEEFVKAQDSRAYGAGVALRLCGTMEANKRIGYDSVNALIREVARKFAAEAEGVEDAVAARISGMEMALLLPATGLEEARTLAEKAVEKARACLDDDDRVREVLYLAAAVIHYDHTKPLEKFLSAVDLALNDAAAQKRDTVRTMTYTNGLPTRKSEWRELLEEAFEKEKLVPHLANIFSENGKEISAELRFDLEEGEKGRIPYRLYAPMMMQLGLFPAYAAYLFGYLLEHPEMQCSRVFVEMPMDYLDTTHHFDAMLAFVKKLKRSGREFVVEFGQSELIHHRDDGAIETIVDELAKAGVGVAIARFDADAKMLELLHKVRPAFVKIDVAQFLDMSDALRNSLLLLLRSIGAKFLVSGVGSPEELEKLQSIGEDFLVV
ncbi:bifunctional diguanylate cyclase/phosphodiesterase [Hydrogenimonas sp.]